MAAKSFIRRASALCMAATSGAFAIPVAQREQGFTEALEAELKGIEADLKTWFCNRKVDMERNKAIHAMLDHHNFVGLSINSEKLPDAQRVLWTDLVMGEPQLEDSLSNDAREMKADMYMTMFKESTDLDTVCRIPGVRYLRCLQDYAADTHANRTKKCAALFKEFKDARNIILQQQADEIQKATLHQNVNDMRAKALFERRDKLLTMMTQHNQGS